MDANRENQTPTQIWTEGMLSNTETSQNLEELLPQHGIQSTTTDEDKQLPAVTVEQPQLAQSQQQQESVCHAIGSDS